MQSTQTDASRPAPPGGMGFKQFVGLIAALMATNALAIDSMLPALPQIGADLGVASHNERQLVITVYLLGMGAAQLVYGSLADRFGRKPVLLAALGGYVVFATACALATSFEMLLAARILTGVAAAGSRVLSVSIVRDTYAGRQMARVMSLAFIVFLAAPIIAPSLGQAIMLVASWRWIFGVLAIFGLTVIIWVLVKLPETLHPEDRVPLRLAPVMVAFRTALTTRQAIGYTFASTVILGGQFGFVNSAQQVFIDALGAGKLFTLIFASIAASMGVAALINARIVERLGMRHVSHTALVGGIIFAAIHALVVISGHENLWRFAVLQAAMMFCMGLTISNFSAISMEPLGHLAGTAASVQGFITIVGGALLGFYVGQSFNGTLVPLTVAFTIFGLVALLAVLITEKGRLFQPAPGRS